MIFITGDTHGHFDVEKIFSFYQNFREKKLTKEDYLIIAGDFGFIWDEQYDKDIEKLGEFDLTFLFVDGNHENFDIINEMPVLKDIFLNNPLATAKTSFPFYFFCIQILQRTNGHILQTFCHNHEFQN